MKREKKVLNSIQTKQTKKEKEKRTEKSNIKNGKIVLFKRERYAKNQYQ